LDSLASERDIVDMFLFSFDKKRSPTVNEPALLLLYRPNLVIIHQLAFHLL